MNLLHCRLQALARVARREADPRTILAAHNIVEDNALDDKDDHLLPVDG